MEWFVAPTYKDWKLFNIDEDARKATAVSTCPKCGGSGEYVIPPYFCGTCFTCNGAGKVSKRIKIYNEKEYNQYLKAQERAKERKKEAFEAKQQNLKDNSAKNKADLLEKWGYDPENPTIYLVAGGSTYDIKDYLKENGFKYAAALNWYATSYRDVPEGYKLVEVNFDDVYDWLPMVKRFQLKENAKEIIAAALQSARPQSKSEYVGELKQRLRDLKVTLTGARAVSSAYGTSVLFTFQQGENILIWFTSCPPDEEKAVIGKEYLLTGTVKDHAEYEGVKQTKLNRCILKEIA